MTYRVKLLPAERDQRECINKFILLKERKAKPGSKRLPVWEVLHGHYLEIENLN